MKVENNILETKEGASIYRGKRRNGEYKKKMIKEEKKNYIFMHTTHIYKSIVQIVFDL